MLRHIPAVDRRRVLSAAAGGTHMPFVNRASRASSDRQAGEGP